MINRGWKEVFKALGIVAAVSLVILLIVTVITGCAVMPESSAGLKIEHHSSAQDVYDTCENNLAGFDIRMNIGRNCGKYCPEVSVGLGWDVRGSPCQGRDPVGEAQFRFPIWSNRKPGGFD